MKFLKSTTDLILVGLTLALIGFTSFGITTGEQFISFLGMVAAYKFGRNQKTVEDTENNLG